MVYKFSFTVGKWIFNTHIRLTNTNNKSLRLKKSLNRSLLVLVIGQAFLIPIFNQLANLISYEILDNSKKLYGMRD
ncbi:UNVERIFIED_CONTAM: hypothetical protein Cloal_1084 [Acetivibrio alkalicellulosi]